MNNEEIGRVGVASIIAVLGALVEAHVELCSGSHMSPKAIFWWLLMVIGSGVIMDATKGSSKKTLLLASAIVASAFLGAAAFMSVLDITGSFCFSGVTQNHPAYIPLVIFVWIITAVSVFLLSFSNPVLKSIVSGAAKNSTADQITNIEKTVRAIIGVIAALILLLQLA